MTFGKWLVIGLEVAIFTMGVMAFYSTGVGGALALAGVGMLVVAGIYGAATE